MSTRRWFCFETRLQSCSPAETVLNHWTREVARRRSDLANKSSDVGTMQEILGDLKTSTYITETYQAKLPDTCYNAIRKFAGLNCTDSRDKHMGCSAF
jgi:hypothetical protein